MTDKTDYQNFELRAQDGTTILWLYPFDGVSADISDNETNSDATERGEPPIARQGHRVTESLSVECGLMDSDELDEPHETALLNLFGKSDGEVVTRQEQYNRLAHYLGEGLGAPYELTWIDNEYTATTAAEVDRQNGVYPSIVVASASASHGGGQRPMSLSLDLQIGLPRRE